MEGIFDGFIITDSSGPGSVDVTVQFTQNGATGSLFKLRVNFVAPTFPVDPGLSTGAGDGTAGSQDSTSPLAGTFTGPRGIAFGPGGNLFIADSQSNLIRRIDVQSGALTTFAGTGVSGNQDNADPLQATIDFPTAIAVDSNGNVYFTELNNNTVRRIDGTTGAVTTVVTGLNGPQGIAVDAAGDVFVSNTNARIIQKLTVSTGVLTTIAGSGANGNADATPATNGSFGSPCGLAVDSGGNIFVADADNHSVRRIDAQTDALTTIAGDGTSGLLDNATATNGQLSFPRAVAVDSAGNVIVGDTGNHAIRIVTAGGSLNTIAGTGVAGFADNAHPLAGQLDDPHGVVVDANGNVFIADRDNNRIRTLNRAP